MQDKPTIAVVGMAGLFPGEGIHLGELPALLLHELGVHPQEHARPVARLGAARPGVDAEEGVAAVVVLGHEAFGLEHGEVFLEGLEVAFGLDPSGLVLFLLGQLEENLQLLGFGIIGQGFAKDVGNEPSTENRFFNLAYAGLKEPAPPQQHIPLFKNGHVGIQNPILPAYDPAASMRISRASTRASYARVNNRFRGWFNERLLADR